MNDDEKLQDKADETRAGEPNGAPAEATETVDSDRLNQLEQELEEVRQHVLYAQAETQNVRRRLEQEKQHASAYAVTGFARDMLSVKDNLDRALAAVPEELKSDDKINGLVTGIEATARELDTVFQRHGITRVAAIGLPLDPNRHQAMIEIPSADAEPGIIIEEMQSGYMIKDRLLRPALVGVAKAVG